jgi:hypothetical protein
VRNVRPKGARRWPRFDGRARGEALGETLDPVELLVHGPVVLGSLAPPGLHDAADPADRRYDPGARLAGGGVVHGAGQIRARRAREASPRWCGRLNPGVLSQADPLRPSAPGGRARRTPCTVCPPRDRTQEPGWVEPRAAAGHSRKALKNMMVTGSGGCDRSHEQARAETGPRKNGLQGMLMDSTVEPIASPATTLGLRSCHLCQRVL